MLVHLVDVSSFSGRDPVEDFDVIQRELTLFRDETARDADSGPLSSKRQIVAANKIDALDEPERVERLRTHVRQLGLELYPVSAVTGQGVKVLLEAIWKAFTTQAPDPGDQRDRREWDTTTPV